MSSIVKPPTKTDLKMAARNAVQRGRLVDEEAAEQAFRATKRMREKLYMLNGFARALTRNPEVRVEVGPMSCTDGKVIYLRPPMRLGLVLQHDRALCGQRAGDTGALLCPRCAQMEEVHTVLFHEMAHIVYDSFETLDDKDRSEVLKRVVEERPGTPGSRLAKIQAALGDLERHQLNNYVAVAQIISPWLHPIVNALEDARVNRAMYQARSGTREMFRARAIDVFENGVPQPDGTTKRWDEMDPNSQVIVGLYVKASQFEYEGWFKPECTEALNDPQLTRLTNQVTTLRSVSGVYRLAFPILERLRELGFCKRADDIEDDPPPEPEPAPTPDAEDAEPDEDEDESEGDDGDDATDADGESSADDSDDEDAPDDDTAEDDAATGDPGVDPVDPDDPTDAPEPDTDDEPADDADDEPADMDSGEDDFGDDIDEAPGQGGDSTDTEADTEADTDEDMGSDYADEDYGAGEANEEDFDDEDFDDEADDELDDEDHGSGESGAGEDFDELDHESPYDEDEYLDYDEPEDQEQFAGSPDDAQQALSMFGGHDKPDLYGESHAEKQAIDQAIVQAEHFDEASATVMGVTVRRLGDDKPRPSWDAWGRGSKYWNYAPADSYDPPEALVNLNLLKLRRVFAANKRAKRLPGQRSGRIVSNLLPSVMVGNDKVFSRSKLPGKKDYFVLLALDVSGSTVGDRIEHIKAMSMAVAEMLSRVGVKFAIYAHEGGTLTKNSPLWNVEMYVVKDERDPWDTQARTALERLQPAMNNLDGHALEFFRKRCDESTATDKLILYVTDGMMPEANRSDERIVLRRELDTCKKKGYTVLGIGIGTDSPRRHGLDTVRIDKIEDVANVVTELERRLEVPVV